MECMKLVAQRHGLRCLLHEKPYSGVNGSGKHNNWSLCTDTGKNLLDPGKTPEENAQFLLILAAILKAVDEYASLMRISVAHAGNDHRLGGGEAPPAIISIFLGEELDALIDSIVDGTAYKASKAGMMDLGVPTVPVFRKDTTDRNRTSPFAFTGNKFEFRMVGSSQNIAMPNIVLNTAVAEEFRQFADILEACEDSEDFDKKVAEIIRKTFTEHKRVIFNGNGYSEEWEKEAKLRGLPNLKTSVDAYKTFNDPKNVELFRRQGVMSETEILSRQEIMFENYSKVINIEALTLIEMVTRDILPAVNSYTGKLASDILAKQSALGETSVRVEKTVAKKLSALASETYDLLSSLSTAEKNATTQENHEKMAEYYLERVIPLMNKIRVKVDTMETLTASEYWPFPTYGEMLFGI
jgi:glutamine synthetase